MGKVASSLLEKFLEGGCSEKELRQVALLLDTDEGYALLDELICQREIAAWNEPVEDGNMQFTVRSKQQEMQQRISANETRYQPAITAKGSNMNRWMRFSKRAAVWTGLLLLSGLATWKFSQFHPKVRYVEKIHSRGAPQRYVLPDSTVVYLAAGSRIRYAHTFPQGSRDIELWGEAFFDVQPDEVHPFMIRSGDLLTRVLGTSFKVIAHEGQQHEVAVATGKISISTIHKQETNELAVLTAGFKVTYDPVSGKTIQGSVDSGSLEQWKAGELVFMDMPLGSVSVILERRYGVKFHFEKPSMAKQVVSGTFSADEPLAGVMDMLGFVGKFSYSISADGETYIIH